MWKRASGSWYGTLCAAILFTSLVACSRQEGQKTSPTSTRSLGTEGGVLETSGARIEFPPGSLSLEQPAEIKTIESPATLVEKNQILVSPVYQIRTEEAYYRKPVLVRLSVDRTKLPEGTDLQSVYPVLLEGGASERIHPYQIDPKSGQLEFSLSRTFPLIAHCGWTSEGEPKGVALAANRENPIELRWGVDGDWQQIVRVGEDATDSDDFNLRLPILRSNLVTARKIAQQPPFEFIAPSSPITIRICQQREGVAGTASGGDTITLSLYHMMISSTSIHEYFHIVQQTYMLRNLGMLKRIFKNQWLYSHLWMDEATASWAEIRLRQEEGKHCMFPDLHFGYRSLTDWKEIDPTSDTCPHQYQSLAFFEHLEKEYGNSEDVIRGFYEAALSDSDAPTLELLARIVSAESGRHAIGRPLGEVYVQFLIHFYWLKDFRPMNQLPKDLAEAFGKAKEIKIPKDHWEVWFFPEASGPNRYRRESAYSGAPFSIVQAITLSNKTLKPEGDGIWNLNLSLETNGALTDVRMIVFPNKGRGWMEALWADAQHPLVIPDWQEHQHALVWLVDVSIKGGTSINLKAELNPKTTPPEEELLTIPDVTGMPEDEARQTLEKAGFRTGSSSVGDPAKRPVEEGTVQSQAPPGRTQAPRGSEVRLTLFAKKSETMPDPGPLDIKLQLEPYDGHSWALGIRIDRSLTNAEAQDLEARLKGKWFRIKATTSEGTYYAFARTPDPRGIPFGTSTDFTLRISPIKPGTHEVTTEVSALGTSARGQGKIIHRGMMPKDVEEARREQAEAQQNLPKYKERLNKLLEEKAHEWDISRAKDGVFFAYDRIAKGHRYAADLDAAKAVLETAIQEGWTGHYHTLAHAVYFPKGDLDAFQAALANDPCCKDDVFGARQLIELALYRRGDVTLARSLAAKQNWRLSEAPESEDQILR